ncbi:10478_t:CDS:2, partial [Scutellospora calospora]
TSSTKLDNITIHSNKASYIVVYFTRNENPEQRLVKQHENLAQIHAKELAQSKNYKLSKKQKSFVQ